MGVNRRKGLKTPCRPVNQLIDPVPSVLVPAEKGEVAPSYECKRRYKLVRNLAFQKDRVYRVSASRTIQSASSDTRSRRKRWDRKQSFESPG